MWFESDLLNILVVLVPVFILMWFDSSSSIKDRGKSKEEIAESSSILKTPTTNLSQKQKTKNSLVEKDVEIVFVPTYPPGMEKPRRQNGD